MGIADAARRVVYRSFAMNPSIATTGLRAAETPEARGRIGLAAFCLVALQLALVLLLRLNEAPLGHSFRRFELLNFGIPGYQPPQQLAAFERALKLQANAIYFVAAGREASRSAAYLAEALHKKLPIPPPLQAIVEQAGVAPGMDEATLAKRLQPFGGAILSAVYRSIGARSDALGIRTVWIMLPQVRDGNWQEETPQAIQAARDAGFQVIDLSDVYRGHDIATLRLAAWDDHPNALGHRLVAERLYRELAAAPDAVSAAAEKR